MKGRGSYMPPLYVPLDQSEDKATEDLDSPVINANEAVKAVVDIEPSRPPPVAARDPTQWSSGIFACSDDMQSCCIGAVCPCYLFGKNAEFLGSGTLAGSCMTHFILWGVLNCLCCICSGGILALVPGSTVACYACGYRRALRAKYTIQEAPCGDLTTHVFCHLCALCQEYREIRERTDGAVSVFSLPTVTAPAVQKMESGQGERAQVECGRA